MMMTVLEGFHHIIDRRIAGMTERRGAEREWECVLVEAPLEAEGICKIMEYVRRHQAKIAEYVVDRHI